MVASREPMLQSPPPARPVAKPGVVPVRLPVLDGFRALAVTLILVHHFGIIVPFLPWYNPICRAGWVAVPLFFVLSATLLALPFVTAGLEDRSYPSPLRFYERRALRIFPIFYLSMAAYLAVHAAWGEPLPSTGEIVRHLLFVHNFQHDASSINPPYWSLAVEVQFYLLMPLFGLVLYRAAKRDDFRAAARVGLALLVVGFVYRLWAVLTPGMLATRGYEFLVYESTISSLDSFGFGFLCAVLHAWAARNGRPIVRAPFAGLLVAASFAGIYTLMWFNPEQNESREAAANWFSPPLYYTLVNAFWAGAVLGTLSLAEDARFGRLMRSRTLGVISTLSYSFYVWHQLAMGFAQRWLTQLGLRGRAFNVAILPLEFVLCAAVSALSYYGIEARFLRKRRELRAAGGAELSPPPLKSG